MAGLIMKLWKWKTKKQENESIAPKMVLKTMSTIVIFTVMIVAIIIIVGFIIAIIDNNHYYHY